MKILVTGAAGFVGSHLVDSLLARGHEVAGVIFDRDPVNHLDPALPVERLVGDLRDPEFCRRASAGRHLLFHLAAALNTPTTSVDDFFSTNVIGTRNIMEAALEAGVEKALHVSSLVTIKEDPTKVNERNVHGPVFNELYTVTKYQGEKEAWEVAAKGLPLVVVNPTVIFGPRDHHTLNEYYRLHLKRRVRFVSFQDSVINLTFVRDAAEAMTLAMEKGRPGYKYILGGTEMTMRQFLDNLDRTWDCRRPLIPVPEWLIHAGVALFTPLFRLFGFHFPILKPQVAAMKRGTAADNSRARGELGVPTSPFPEAIRETLDWYRSIGYL